MWSEYGAMFTTTFFIRKTGERMMKNSRLDLRSLQKKKKKYLMFSYSLKSLGLGQVEKFPAPIRLHMNHLKKTKKTASGSDFSTDLKQSVSKGKHVRISK